MIFPNYTDGSIVNLVSSILAYYGVDNIYAPLKDFTLPKHKKLVFIVIDGMGWNFLDTHCKDSTLYKLTNSTMTSVFPSTTSAALTSLMTGVAPLQHSLTGWFMYFKELATTGVPLSFTPRYTEKTFAQQDVNINDILDFQTIFQKINRPMMLISPAATIHSPFSNYCYGDKGKIGFETIKQCFEMIVSAITAPPAQAGGGRGEAYHLPLTTYPDIIYAYIPHFDDVAHHHGINSPQAINFFHEIDAHFAKTIEATKNTATLFIVTADHGLVDTTKENVLNIKDFPDVQDCLILPLCGEPRVPYCYIRPSKYEQFKKAVDSQMKDYCDRYPLSDLLDKNFYGFGAINPKTIDHIGDEVLLMKENYVLLDTVYKEKHKNFIGFHGGCHPDEMIVPLITHHS